VAVVNQHGGYPFFVFVRMAPDGLSGVGYAPRRVE
jgi:hypothetical protein